MPLFAIYLVRDLSWFSNLGFQRDSISKFFEAHGKGPKGEHKRKERDRGEEMGCLASTWINVLQFI
jgi:hypothetical protein